MHSITIIIRPLLLPLEMQWLLVSHNCSCHRLVSLKAIGLLQPPDYVINPNLYQYFGGSSHSVIINDKYNKMMLNANMLIK